MQGEVPLLFTAELGSSTADWPQGTGKKEWSTNHTNHTNNRNGRYAPKLSVIPEGRASGLSGTLL
jgi:hypothetical protein